jgi:hypothetical protein
VALVKSAKEWGWSPSALIRNATNPHKHHPADYALAHAVQVLTEEKCPKCGVPIWHAFSEDSDVDFKEDLQKCYSCAHQEDAKKDRKDSPGESYTVRAVPAEGAEKLPTRGDFYEAQHKKAVARMQRELEQRQQEQAA